jgi:DNA-binding MurR/RpiR family transcriptional regulator
MSDHMMQHYATLREEDLSPAQELALAALLTGQTVTAAAKAAEVDRSTIHRWIRHSDHRGFAKALVRGRAELRQALAARLLALAPKAADCLEAALASGDGKCALALLKGLGYLQ